MNLWTIPASICIILSAMYFVFGILGADGIYLVLGIAFLIGFFISYKMWSKEAASVENPGQ